MPFCGFNDKMLKGLTEFNEGLIEHGLMFNSQKNNETIEQAIRREISDMARFLSETQRIDDSSKRFMTEGLVKYVIYFYMIMRTKGINDYKEVVGSISQFFYKMDNKYYSELEGKTDDMKQLAEYLDKLEI